MNWIDCSVCYIISAYVICAIRSVTTGMSDGFSWKKANKNLVKYWSVRAIIHLTGLFRYWFGFYSDSAGKVFDLFSENGQSLKKTCCCMFTILHVSLTLIKSVENVQWPWNVLGWRSYRGMHFLAVISLLKVAIEMYSQVWGRGSLRNEQMATIPLLKFHQNSLIIQENVWRTAITIRGISQNYVIFQEKV